MFALYFKPCHTELLLWHCVQCDLWLGRRAPGHSWRQWPVAETSWWSPSARRGACWYTPKEFLLLVGFVRKNETSLEIFHIIRHVSGVENKSFVRLVANWSVHLGRFAQFELNVFNLGQKHFSQLQYLWIQISTIWFPELNKNLIRHFPLV